MSVLPQAHVATVLLLRLSVSLPEKIAVSASWRAEHRALLAELSEFGWLSVDGFGPWWTVSLTEEGARVRDAALAAATDAVGAAAVEAARS